MRRVGILVATSIQARASDYDVNEGLGESVTLHSQESV